ncbi:MAG: alpha/beta hydrolase [Lachnospiraceae bacterium]|nr:alpha/beta hydrolase [Lachnospiraceae bacterium]
MKILEYGDVENPIVLLVHGMGCAGEHSFEQTIKRLSQKYKIILPLLDGYDGEHTTFSTIADQAKQIYDYFRQRGIKKLYAAIGMSMGGFICLDLFSKYNLHTDRLILDSGYMDNMPFPQLVSSAIAWGFSKLQKKKWMPLIRAGMKKMMGYCFRPDDLYPASRQTIFNSELSCATYELPENLSRIHAGDIVYWYGEKEKYMIKGMHTLKKYLPQMDSVSRGNVGHGEIMFESPEQYAENIMDTLETK